MREGKQGKVRIKEPQREQGEIRYEIPDQMISEEHPARLLWNVLGTLDLSRFSKDNEAVEGKAGRSVLSPRMLLTLWMYGISQGVGSARKIAKLVGTEVGYRWVIGNLTVSHHKLSQFRVGHGEALSELMTDVLASLMEKGLLRLERVSQDGTRTRASATAPSFRTYGSLIQCREQAALHLKAVLAAAEDPEYSGASHKRRETAARDYQERVEAAIKTVVELQKERGPKDKAARASSTDAEARVMKMGDGGFRPAYNVQYSVAGSEFGGARTVVGVKVTNVGSDMGSLEPMMEQIKERTGQLPETVLADGGHAKQEDIVAVERMGVKVVVPPPDNAKPIAKLVDVEPEVIAWRERMETEEAHKQYRSRASLCELVNAHQKSLHGIDQFLVRGIEKVTCVVLLGVLCGNLLQHATRLLS